MPGLISGRCAHDVSRLFGRRLGALLPVDAHKVGQGGTAGELRGRVVAKEGQQHVLKKQRSGHAFHAADGGVRQLKGKEKDEAQLLFLGIYSLCIRASSHLKFPQQNLHHVTLA